jgi:hypothetical protein
MKKIILAILLCAAMVGATELVDRPFQYFLGIKHVSKDTALWGVTPGIMIPDLILTSADSGKTGLDVQAFTSVGVGLDYGRYVMSESGKIYETIGVSLFTLLATDKTVSLGFGIHLFNRTIGVGGGVDCGNVSKNKRFKGYLLTGLKLF